MKKYLFILPLFVAAFSACENDDCYSCEKETLGITEREETCDESKKDAYEVDGWTCVSKD